MRTRPAPWGLLLLAFLPILLPPAVGAQELPLFDAHIHYSREAWERYPPGEIIRLMDRAGIRRALVSSTPDEGTWRLHTEAPERVVPLLRLYREAGDSSGWHRDASLLEVLERELGRRAYRGVGEVHLEAGDAEAPVVDRAVRLAVQRGLPVQVHTGEEGMQALLVRYPRARFLWAHSGLGSPAAAARRLLEGHPNLWVELSLRYDVAPGGSLDPEWRGLFLAFPDRFLVGTDTWIVSRWESLEETARFNRGWLRQLPVEVGEKIAWRNGEALFPPAP
ncbi:MAG: hypothetical protein A2V99_12105 [Spirochaetes bacterium RBG_16_67_19]|nr:MAG: hypothetical protein A2V99_12105 [Spirochaetes bacterium RBG_16_67_19]